MSTVNVWSGAVGPTTATVIAKVSGTSTRLAYATNAALSSPAYTSTVVPTAEGISKFVLTGLTLDTQYWYAVEDGGVLDTTKVGRFHTHGVIGDPYSFSFMHATCAGLGTTNPVPGALLPNQVSTHPVFDDIRAQSTGHLFFAHGGDLHYYDIGGTHGDPDWVADSSPPSYRRAYDDVLLGRQGDLFRAVPIQYMWDDHDYGPNDSNSASPGKLSAAQVYRERVPHYTLAEGDTGTGAVYHSFQVGRVLFIATDGRYYRQPTGDPAPRGHFGATQLSWMEGVLAASDAKFLVWQQEQSWTSLELGAPGWGSYVEERDQIVQMLGDTGWLTRMLMLVGDSHAMAMDTGGGNAYGGFPIFMFSPLDSNPTVGPLYDLGRRGSGNGGGRGQWGTVDVADNGSTIRVTGNGWWWSP